MKTEFTEVSETRKHLTFEIEPDVVEAEIARVAQGYSKTARVPGFRQGKVPTGVVKQRYKDQILYDVAHDLIPRLVGEALKERGLNPVATPDIRDVVIEEGKPLTFVADFETMPQVDPGTYTGLTLRRPPAVLDVGAVDAALERLQLRAARWHPVEDRKAAVGDTLMMDLVRTPKPRLIQLAGETPRAPEGGDTKPESLKGISVELGAKANPPGFDDNLLGSGPGDHRTFLVTYPAEYEMPELAGTTMEYAVIVSGVRRRELPPIDDDFAKEVSDLDSLEALRARIKDDLQHEAEHESEHKVRNDLLEQLATRIRTAPDALVDHEIDRRLEEFVRRLMDQGMDPMKTNIDWQEFRQRQRQPAENTVKSTLVLDEIARRESIESTDEDLSGEIEKFAERSGRTAQAVRAGLEKDHGIGRVRGGIRREKTVKWLVDRANIVNG
jgi:trigger factor